jgi:ABC-type sugar transport system ATPase subunit
LASEPVLSVSGLTCEPAFRDVSFTVRPGQVIGLAGLSGSGCSEVLAALFGAGEFDGGTIELAGEPYLAIGPREAIEAGIGYVPPDRKTQGLLLDMASSDNIATAASHRRPRWHRISRAAELTAAKATADRVGLDSAVLQRPARALSGGNQQKVLLAKWLATEPRVLLLDEPTRGVDVGAKAEIHRRLREVADEGLALVVTSSDIPELIGLCEEIMVFFRGRIVARLHAGDISEAAISAAAGGHS